MPAVQLTDEIKEMVKKQLPGIHADTLGAFFKEAEINKMERERLAGLLKEETARSQQLSNSFHNTKEKLEKLQKEVGDLSKREAEVLERENRQTIVEVKKECAEDKVKLATDLFGQVFRNTELRRELHHSHSEYVDGYSRGNDYVQPHSINRTEDKTETETQE